LPAATHGCEKLRKWWSSTPAARRPAAGRPMRSCNTLAAGAYVRGAGTKQRAEHAGRHHVADVAWVLQVAWMVRAVAHVAPCTRCSDDRRAFATDRVALCCIGVFDPTCHPPPPPSRPAHTRTQMRALINCRCLGW
jgi:hypothetical protein